MIVDVYLQWRLTWVRVWRDIGEAYLIGRLAPTSGWGRLLAHNEERSFSEGSL